MGEGKLCHPIMRLRKVNRRMKTNRAAINVVRLREVNGSNHSLLAPIQPVRDRDFAYNSFSRQCTSGNL